MNNQEGEIRSCSYNKHDDDYDDDGDDHHHHDMVMPGFRFHPTEQELIEFYLRRKVEGKRFNVELITRLDLYRYDPWELPALAAIDGKEWYFYVRRDRKYRNGDRPNRVTASGYWKATGADRSIKSDDFRAVIGLKKTLVFYSGKAPKGVRTSWIMNEYRLLPPLNETEKLEKGEICLCRVYKRAGIIQENPTLQILTKRASSSSNESSSTSTLLFTRNHHHNDRTSSITSSPFAVDTDDDLLKLVMNNNSLTSSPSCLNNQENPNRVHDDDDDVYPNSISVPYNLLLPSSSTSSQTSASQMIAYADAML